MEQTYQNILRPLVVQGVVLKNRLYGTKGLPHFQQGPEIFPSENVLRYYANLARNGAAVVTVKGMSPMPGMPPMPKQDGPFAKDGDYTLECDSVVVCGGVAPEQDSALAFSGCARQFFLIGDSREPGRVYQATRSAYAAASQI